MLLMVDVDSTLYDADLLFQELAAEEDIPWIANSSHWFRPQDIEVDEAALSRLFKKAHERQNVMRQIPYFGSPEILTELFNKYDGHGLDIWYVSNRDPLGATALSDWLRAFCFPTSENVIAIKDKREWIRASYPDIVIDDRVQTILMARYECGAQVLSVKHAHNINLSHEAEGVYICDDWFEIGTLLKEKVIPLLMNRYVYD